MKRSYLAQWLKEARLKSGLSQGDVARELGYSSPQFISNWERGLSQPPVVKLKKLCKMYSVSIDDAYQRYLKAALTEVQEKIHQEFYPHKKRSLPSRSLRKSL